MLTAHQKPPARVGASSPRCRPPVTPRIGHAARDHHVGVTFRNPLSVRRPSSRTVLRRPARYYRSPRTRRAAAHSGETWAAPDEVRKLVFANEPLEKYGSRFGGWDVEDRSRGGDA